METAMQAEELREIFRHNVLSRRKQLAMTQTELAEKCGFSQPFIAEFESGRKVPRLDNLASLAEALETTPQALLSPEIFSKIVVDSS